MKCSSYNSINLFLVEQPLLYAKLYCWGFCRFFNRKSSNEISAKFL